MSSLTNLRDKNKKSLKFALVITAIFFFVELIGGYLTNSLALISDAGHMLTDVLALGMSLLAMWFAQRPASDRHSFGFYRVEILAALLNGITLVGISIYIFVEAYNRFQNPPEVAGFPMMIIAVTGLIVNLLSGYMLHHSKDDSLNVRGAYLHVLGDALGSVGAIIAGIIMWTAGWMFADPLFSVFIGLIIIYSSGRLLKETVHILMQGTPENIAPLDVRAAISDIQYVTDVHDLHVWTLTNGIDSLTAHICLAPETPKSLDDQIIREIREMSKDRFGIEHTTVQIEHKKNSDHGCIMQE